MQPLVRARVAALGASGRTWVDALPGTLAELAARWSLRLGGPLPGGSASYLVTAVRADGSEAVLKVALPEKDSGAHGIALRRAGGRGYVRLRESAPEHSALLLERLGPSLAASGVEVETQLELLATTLQTAWREPAEPAVDKAGSLAAELRAFQARMPAAVDPWVVDLAVGYASELADPGPDDLVGVHGDAHPGNLLRVRHPRPGAETGWCFVDPDPFVADRAYDLGVAVRDFSTSLLADPGSATSRLRSWCRRVAAPSGVDPGRVWAWGFLERVSTGLYVTSFGAPRVGEPFLRSARLLGEQAGALPRTPPDGFAPLPPRTRRPG